FDLFAHCHSWHFTTAKPECACPGPFTSVSDLAVISIVGGYHLQLPRCNYCRLSGSVNTSPWPKIECSGSLNAWARAFLRKRLRITSTRWPSRSEEHTSEL